MINDKDVQINELKTLLDYYSQFKNWAEFIEVFFKIKDKDTGALIPFKLSNIQRKTFNTLLQQYNREKKVDAIICINAVICVLTEIKSSIIISFIKPLHQLKRRQACNFCNLRAPSHKCTV